MEGEGESKRATATLCFIRPSLSLSSARHPLSKTSTSKKKKLAATIGKLARDAAAPVLAGTNARISGDAIDATLSCADEFVRLVYAEGKGSYFSSSLFFR